MAEVETQDAPALKMPPRQTFELTCDGPGWKALPVVNGHVCPVASVDVHLDPQSFPEVTLRLIPADLLKAGFDPAVIKVDDETRDALVSLGWTPPAERPACACGSTHPEGYECSQAATLPLGTEPVTP
jgi:hypothetical protein